VSNWTSILEPSSAVGRQAQDAITQITNDIYDRAYPPKVAGIRHRWQYEAPLIYGYFALAYDDQVWLDRAMENLNAAVSDASILQRSLDLFGGVCGLGWSVAHLQQLLAPVPDLVQAREDEGDDLNADVDGFLIHNLQSAKWDGPYDLIGGLVGFGTYFLERFPAGRSLEGIKLIVGHLETISQPFGSGIAWHSRPGLLPDWQRERCPDGYYNLGVAHGIPGILHFLAEVAAADLDERAAVLLAGGMEWLMSQKRPAGSLSWFSSWVAPGESHDSRLTWCYGDLGILAVLLQIVRRFPRKEWKDFTQRLLDHCLAWPPELAGINDAALCHGATGVAHIFNRIYQAEGDVRCREAAVAWFERTLAMRVPGTGVGGFSAASRPDLTGPLVWEVSPAFLDGSLGIALALLSALTPIEPQWDRMLLLSSKGSAERQSTCTANELMHYHES
jgi:lantibiotic biosynthesis protein